MLICSDALQHLRTMSSNFVDLCLTDPPYYLHKMDANWKIEDLNYVTKKQTITSLPGGMKLDAKKGKEFYDFYLETSKEIWRVLKPGAFFFSFSAPRLYHRMACAVEDAGFLIKDCFIWLYTQSQPKAMSLNRFLKEGQEIDARWKTPQIKSCFEPIAVAQKPPDGTLLENFLKYKVGLFDTGIKLGDNMFPANCVSDEPIGEELDRYFLVKKPSKAEKGTYNTHPTTKPLEVCKYIIELSTQRDAIVLDPFVGSGTTCVAAKQLGRNYVGIDANKEYLDIAEKRLNDNLSS